MTTASVISDAEGITSLLATQPTGSALRYADRQLRYLTPASTNYTQSVNFDMVGIDKILTDWKDAFLYLPLQVKSAVAFADVKPFPPVAFKSSVLSAIHRVVVRSANGPGLNIDQGRNALQFANHLRLAMEKDQDWLQAVAPEIHWSRDRSHPGVIGLKNTNEIAIPNISPYSAVPSVGLGTESGGGLNPAYNAGFAERSRYLMQASATDAGVFTSPQGTQAINFVARIPLRAICDFLHQLGESGPLFNLRLQMEFHIASAVHTSFGPLTLGSVVGVGSAANTPTAGGALDVVVSGEPRLYYHQVVLRPEHQAVFSAQLDAGYQKRVVFKDYDVLKDESALKNLADGASISHRISSSAVSPQRLWCMCYPTGLLDGTQWPSVLTTGPNGCSSFNVSLNGMPFLTQPMTNVYEQYEALKDAGHVGADSDERECMIPFNDFRHTSRLLTCDLSRAGAVSADPNGPNEIMAQITLATQSAQNVDVVFLLERKMEAIFDFKQSSVQVVVAPGLFV